MGEAIAAPAESLPRRGGACSSPLRYSQNNVYPFQNSKLNYKSANSAVKTFTVRIISYIASIIPKGAGTMSPADFIILAAVAIGLFFAVRSIVRQKKRGGCAGCPGCTGDCSSCGKQAK